MGVEKEEREARKKDGHELINLAVVPYIPPPHLQDPTRKSNHVL